MGAPQVTQPFPFFKETETNQNCCGCNKNGGQAPFVGSAASEIPQVVGVDPGLFNTMPSSATVFNGHQLLRTDRSASVQMLQNPLPIGTGQLNGAHAPVNREFGKAQTLINMDLVHADKR